ncbi:hypothetical protein NHQ30_009748 [Ciborinia camelliae]|nr:hypothetical protein NHQ30_009748 [Ciborinia camelliae]
MPRPEKPPEFTKLGEGVEATQIIQSHNEPGKKDYEAKRLGSSSLKFSGSSLSSKLSMIVPIASTTSPPLRSGSKASTDSISPTTPAFSIEFSRASSSSKFSSISSASSISHPSSTRDAKPSSTDNTTSTTSGVFIKAKKRDKANKTDKITKQSSMRSVAEKELRSRSWFAGLYNLKYGKKGKLVPKYHASTPNHPGSKMVQFPV